MTPDELTAIEQRAEAAIAGPWTARMDDQDDVLIHDAHGHFFAKTATWLDLPDAEAVAAFIAACRTDVPALCRKVRRLTAENDELRARPTLEQAIEALGNVTWYNAESYKTARRVVRQLYAEEQPHD